MARVAKHRAERIAQERIEQLYEYAQEQLQEHPEDSRRAINILRSLATKHNLRITDKKRTFCKECSTPLVPGKTSTVRVHDKRRVITCKHCGTVKRLGISEHEHEDA